MKTLQSVTNQPSAFSFGIPGGYIGSRHASSTLFQDNQYIRELNHTLLVELGNIQLFKKASGYNLKNLPMDFCLSEHQVSARVLTMIIIANKGLPVDGGSTFQTELSLVATQFSGLMPEKVAKRTIVRTLRNSEKWTLKRYDQLLKVCPGTDRQTIEGLKQKSFQILVKLQTIEKILAK